MNVVHVLRTDFGDYPMPPHMIEAAKGIRFRKYDTGWPDMRTKAGKRWVELFKEFSDQKAKEWMAAA